MNYVTLERGKKGAGGCAVGQEDDWAPVVRLTKYEEDMLAGKLGAVRANAMAHMLSVAEFFDAVDLVPVSQAHIMADTEALGEAGVAYLEELARHPWPERRVLVPTLTDPRGSDFKAYAVLKQDPTHVALERRAARALEALGILMTDSCINYQTIMPPAPGESLAFGDTGVVIYSNSVLAARSNFEGGPSALAAALTGRTPRYGFHLDAHRQATARFRVEARLFDLSDWGALGGIIGQRLASYWAVPAIEGLQGPLGSDCLKHLGAAMASFGSTALYHLVGLTPEAPRLESVFPGDPPAAETITSADLQSFVDRYEPKSDALDVVVFAAPQLSLLELQRLAALLEGRRVHGNVCLIATTSPEIKSAGDRMGLTGCIEKAGGLVLEGVCFYQMHAREMGRANGWQSLMTNSAKLVNIIGGYDYQPTIASMQRCVDSAVAGRILT